MTKKSDQKDMMQESDQKDMMQESDQKDMMQESDQKDMMKKSYHKALDFGGSDNPNTRLLNLIKNEHLQAKLPINLVTGLNLEETEMFTHLKNVAQIEEGLLGGILLDAGAMKRVVKTLENYEFSFQHHQMIYDACLRIHRRKKRIDIMMVVVELNKFGELEKVGGQYKIAGLVDKTTGSVNVDQYAKFLVESSHQNPINQDGSLKLWAVQEIVEAIIKEKTEAKAEILLEELRLRVGMSYTKWSKFIASTVRSARKERYRQELKRVLVIDDPLDQSDEIHEICEVYRVSERKVKQDLATMERKTYAGKKRGMKPAIEYDEIESDPVPFLIPGLLPKGQSILLSGLSGTGKTIFALDLVEALLEGEPIYGFNPIKPCKVLLLITDQPKWATMSYIRNKGIDTTNPNLMLWLRDDQQDDPGFTINDLLELRKGLEDFRPDFIVADSLRTIISHPVGISENDVLIGNYVSKVIQECTRFGATLLMIHHDNKSTEQQGISKASGSGDIPARFDIHWQLSTPMGSSYPQRDLKTGKTRSVMIDGRFNFDPDEFRFELEHWNIESPEISKSLSNTMNRIHHILQLNKNGLAIWQIQETLNKAKTATVRTIRRCLAKMTEQLMIGRKKHPEHQRAFLYFLGKDNVNPASKTETEQSKTEETYQSTSPKIPQEKVQLKHQEAKPTQTNLSLDKTETKEMLTREFKYEFHAKEQLKKQDFIKRFEGHIPSEWIREVFDEMIATGRFVETNKMIRPADKYKPKFKQGDAVVSDGRYGRIDRPAAFDKWYVSFNDSYIHEVVNESDLEFYQK